MPTGHRKRVLVRPVFLVMTGVVVGGAFLLGTPQSSHGGTPKGIPLGIFRAHPEVTLVSRWDDNVFKTATDQHSDMIAQIKPVIRLVTHWASKNQFTMSYTATVERYSKLKGENSNNQQVDLDLILVLPARRVEFDLGYSLLKEQDKRGTPESTSLEEPGRWLQHSLTAATNIKFNRLDTKLKLEHAERSSANDGPSDQDRYWNDAGFILNWDLTAKTHLLTELGHKIIVYDQSPLLDSTESRLLLGINWQATGKTEGKLKFGSVTKLFENDTENDSTEVTWESGIAWNPQERTRLNFSSNRGFHEGGEQAEHYVSTQVKVDLKHDLRPNWSLLGELDFSKNVFVPVRRDNYWNGKLGLEYQLRRWFVLNAEFARNIKHSSVAETEYVSNGLLLSLTGTL